MSLLVLRRIGRLFTAGERGVLVDAAVAVAGNRIAWVGPDRDLDAWLRSQPAVGAASAGEPELLDCGGGLVTPGLVDAHAHPLYAGDRWDEVAARSAGAGYLEIAAAGGGIGATVRATRAAGKEELQRDLEIRLRGFLEGGTTTVEAKTGYFLDEAGELAGVRMLAELAGVTGGASSPGRALPRVEVTFLGAHAVPPERAGDQGAYASDVASWCEGARAAGARHCDVFCDEGYFTVEDSRHILLAAREAGLLARLHADELACTGGAVLAAELGAASADHLLRVDEEGVRALAGAGVVATLAPTTALSMGRMPPTRSLLDAGVTIALGTDHNPGTCGTTSMSLVVALGVAALGLSVTEALMAATAGGAASLRLGDRGRVAPRMLADLVCWDADHEGAFAWSYGLVPRLVLGGGAVVRGAVVGGT